MAVHPSDRATIEDLILASNELEALARTDDTLDARALRRAIGFLEREIERRSRRQMPEPLGTGTKPEWAAHLGGPRPLTTD